MMSERVTDLMAALEESLANAKAKQRRKEGEPMGQPLTLDEIGVADADAAQAIYDLRRRCTAMEDTTRRLRDLLVEARAEVDRWGHGDFHYGDTPRDKGVLAMLAKLDAELGIEP